MGTKYCSKCKQVKTLDQFHTDRTKKSGVTSKCRECRNNGDGRKTTAERFWQKVDKRGEDDCWNWNGPVITNTSSLSPTKRGVLGIQTNGKQINKYAYRLSWELHFGEIPKGMFVCHKCDNPLCVNPKHLFLGTAKDNWDDMLNKGRAHYQRFTRVKTYRMSYQEKRFVEAQAIIEYRHSGKTLREIGNIYGLSESAVSRIVNKNRRAHPVR